MKGLMVLANGFEDTEALTTYDVLKRSGLEVITATPNTDLMVTTQCNHQMKAQLYLHKVNPKDFDFLVLPGGRAVKAELSNSSFIDNLISDFVNNRKLVCAICAAPSLLGKGGHLKNINYTCFPGFECSDGKHQNDSVVITDHFITAKSMYYSIDFALAIIEKLQGKVQKEKVLKSLKGEN